MKIKLKTQQFKIKLKIKIPDGNSWVIRQLEIQRKTFKPVRKEIEVSKNLIFNY